MVNQPIIISAVAATDYVIAVLFYNSSPNAEVQRVVAAPGEANTSKNFMFVGINPGPATVRWYTSIDGDELTTLMGTFQINISKQVPILEYRWYKVGGVQTDDDGNIIDPAPDQRELTDPYFEGKIVTAIQRKGTGLLQNEVDWTRIDNTLTLLNPENGLPDGPVFVAGDDVAVLISYLIDALIPATDSNIQINVITEDTTLDASHRNKWNMLLGTGDRLTIVPESLSTLVDGVWYGFMTNGGLQIQTLFDLDGSDTINVNGVSKGRVAFGKMETWQIFKRGSQFEIKEGADYLKPVGRFFKTYHNTDLNALLCDGAQYNGDDYPRVWDYILSLPVGFAVNSSTVTTFEFGKWHYWESGGNKYFRVPNKQNSYGRNLKSFSSRGTDTDRLSDYPGGFGVGKVGRHRHFIMLNTELLSSIFPPIITKFMAIIRNYGKSGAGAESYYLAGSSSEPSAGRTSEGHIETSPTTTENLTSNTTDSLGEFEFVII